MVAVMHLGRLPATRKQIPFPFSARIALAPKSAEELPSRFEEQHASVSWWPASLLSLVQLGVGSPVPGWSTA